MFVATIVVPMIFTSPAGETGPTAMKIEYIGSVSPAFTIRITVRRVPYPSSRESAWIIREGYQPGRVVPACRIAADIRVRVDTATQPYRIGLPVASRCWVKVAHPILM